MLPFHIVEPIPVYRGDFWEQEFRVVDSDDIPIDLSGVDWESHWKQSTNSSKIISLSVYSAQESAGIIKISATSEQTIAMNGDGLFDIQRIVDGKIFTLCYGSTDYTWDITYG